MRKSSWLCIALLAVLLMAAGPAMATNRVLAIGDSWGAAIPSPLNSELASHGHGTYQVLDRAQPGSTAELWADGWLLTVAGDLANPDIEVVLISLGGNDLLGFYPGQGSAVFDQIETDLRTIVDVILGVRPDVDIVFTGYDILKFDNLLCAALAQDRFGTFLPWEVNPLFIEIRNRQQAIANDYPAVTSLNLFGTGQGSPGSPDIFSWATVDNYVNMDDCIHLTSSGYNKFVYELYCAYFAPRFGETCSGPGPICSVAAPGARSLPFSGGDGADLAVMFGLPLAAVLFWRRRSR